MLAFVQKTTSPQQATPGQLWGLGAQRTLEGWADGWPGELVPSQPPFPDQERSRWAERLREPSSDSFSSPSSWAGFMQPGHHELGPSFALLVPTLQSKEDIRGEVSNARPKGFPMVGVGQPCGFSGCPESVPCWDLLPTLSGSRLVSRGTYLQRDRTGSSLNPTSTCKADPHPPSQFKTVSEGSSCGAAGTTQPWVTFTKTPLQRGPFGAS